MQYKKPQEDALFLTIKILQWLFEHILTLNNKIPVAKALYLYCKLSKAKGFREPPRDKIATTLSKGISKEIYEAEKSLNLRLQYKAA